MDVLYFVLNPAGISTFLRLGPAAEISCGEQFGWFISKCNPLTIMSTKSITTLTFGLLSCEIRLLDQRISEVPFILNL